MTPYHPFRSFLFAFQADLLFPFFQFVVLPLPLPAVQNPEHSLPPHVPCSQATALHKAAQGGHLELCKFLVEVRADVAAKDSLYDPLPSVQKLFFLYFLPIFCFPLFNPSCSASAPASGSKLRTSPPPPHVPCSQSTPLHNAAEGGHLETSKFLVQVKADVAAKNRFDTLLRARACV
jgi:hypothetical protein